MLYSTTKLEKGNQAVCFCQVHLCQPWLFIISREIDAQSTFMEMCGNGKPGSYKHIQMTIAFITADVAGAHAGNANSARQVRDARPS
jgi:hypothetical protein